MKRILFVMQSLYNGGAERSLVNLLNELPKDKFDISLLLFKREGMFLKQVPEEVHILYTPTFVPSISISCNSCTISIIIINQVLIL